MMSPNRSPVPYLWPRRLLRPKLPQKLIYLDLNHWIELSRIKSGRARSADKRNLLDVLLRSVGQTAVFPLSSSLYSEILKLNNHRQRRLLREVIEPVSRYLVVTSGDVIAQLEMESLLDREVGLGCVPPNEVAYLDWGVHRAFGLDGRLKIKDKATGADVTAEVRHGHPAGPDKFDEELWNATVLMNRAVLDGPTPGEEPFLRKDGWRPEAILAHSDELADGESALVDRLNKDPKWRRNRLRDVIAAREVIFWFRDVFDRACVNHGFADIGDLLARQPEIRHHFHSMPSFDVYVTLKEAYHRNQDHLWTHNDMHDLMMLSSVVSYCDVVVTDKAAASHVNATGLAKRANTVVLSKLEDVLAHIGCDEPGGSISSSDRTDPKASAPGENGWIRQKWAR